MNRYRTTPRRRLEGSPFNFPETVAPVEQYAVDDKVTHDRYGMGTVVSVEEGLALLIDFGSHSQRIAVPCAKLTKL
jgi:hypothetical protein